MVYGAVVDAYACLLTLVLTAKFGKSEADRADRSDRSAQF